ncbi:hypothetical protein BDV18DRAFT_128045 [Aspergillus unguis]
MGISTHGRAFSNDILCMQISGPDRPHLTIVDLPGLIHSETKLQSDNRLYLRISNGPLLIPGTQAVQSHIPVGG